MKEKRLVDQLHPHVSDWLTKSLGDPTPAQEECVPKILRRESVLLSSPTGTGKTLAGVSGRDRPSLSRAT